MKTLMMKGDYRSSSQMDSEDVKNEDTTSQAQPEEDNADVESNTLGGTADSGPGPVGDGQPAEPSE
jgi:hypothetical protein